MEIVPQKHQKLRTERSMFSSSDDNAMLKQILASHAPDGHDFGVRPLLNLVEDVFNRATLGVPGIPQQGTQAQIEALEDKALHSDLYEMLEVLSYPISKVSNEILYKCSSGGDAHSTTMGIFNILSNYSWDAKVVLALAAFAINYGEFWLLAQLYTNNLLAKDIALLKQLPEILERADILRPKFEALNNLIKAMLDVAKCIVEFKQLPSQYISPDTPEMISATTHIPTAAYWTIRSIVACASQITGLVGVSHEYLASTAEAWELSSLAHKVNNIYKHLLEQLTRCHRHIDEKRHNEAFQTLVRLFETPHIDNMKILKALIYPKDDQPPLIDGSTNRKVNIDVLRRKNVLLLISDLDLPNPELSMMDQMYTESKQQRGRPESEYEVVWLPIVDRSTPWTDEKHKKFEALRAQMPWYSVAHPSLIDPAVIKYIKEYWHYNRKPILVVLDPQGKVVNPNAIHMMWIWGSLAYPFTSSREEALWKDETWRIELLVDSVEPLIFNWIADGKHICLYGGEDLGWIRKFTKTAQSVALAAKIPLEMLYVGKSNPGDKVRRNITAIMTEKLSHTLPDLTLVWFFWVRLESMLYSKAQRGKTVEDDTIMQETMTMLSFDSSDQCWAVISLGSANIARAKAETITKCFDEFEQWKEIANQKGFVPALKERLQELHTPHHCNRVILPSADGTILEKVVCSECGRPMEKFLMYRCCTD